MQKHLVSVENLPEQAAMKISAHITSITGMVSPTPPKYIDGQMLDLTDKDSQVQFMNEFEISNNFWMEIKGKTFTPYSQILEMTNGIYKIELKYMKGIFAVDGDEQSYFVLNAYNKLNHYRGVSNLITLNDVNSLMKIVIVRTGALYEIKSEVL